MIFKFQAFCMFTTDKYLHIFLKGRYFLPQLLLTSNNLHYPICSHKNQEKKRNTCRRQTFVLKIVYLPALKNKSLQYMIVETLVMLVFSNAKHHMYINRKHYICSLFKKMNIIHIPSSKFIMPHSTVCLPRVDPVQMEYLR